MCSTVADEHGPSTYSLDLDDMSPRRTSRRREERRRDSRRKAVRAGLVIALGVPSLLASFMVGWNVLGGGDDVSVKQAALPATSPTTDPVDKASTPVSGPKVSKAPQKPAGRTSTDGASRETVRTPSKGSTTSTTTSKAPAPKTTTSTSAKPAQTSSTSKKPASGTGSSDSGAEAEVLRLVNAERAKAGCRPVTADATLARVAEAHSKDMAVNAYFDHNSQNGKTPFQRMAAAGYAYSFAAENIAAGQQTPASVMGSWMNSPGHKANILNCDLKELGVGVWTEPGSPYGIYWTQDFGTPR